MNSSAPQNSRSRLLVALGVVTVLAIGFAILEFTLAQKSKDSLTAAARVHQADVVRQQELTQKVAAAEQAQAQLKTQLAAQTAAPPRQPAPPVRSPGESAADAARKKAQEDGQAFMAMFDAQVRPLLMNVGRAQIERNFANLIRSGKLTPAQIEALEAATAEHWIGTIEVAPNSIHPGDPNLKY
jgi:hypothetical protein